MSVVCLTYLKQYLPVPERCTSSIFFQLVVRFVLAASARKFPYIRKDIGPVLPSRFHSQQNEATLFCMNIS